MKIYHQAGHNFVWNLESLNDDRAGDGLIISPVNISRNRVEGFSGENKASSIFDPQFYLPKDLKGQLKTYEFFPANLKEKLKTTDIEENSQDIARECVNFQIENGFNRIVIPTRYFEEQPSNFLSEQEEIFVEPFVRYAESLNKAERISVTIILKPIQLTDVEKRAEILNWITGLQGVSGVFAIFQQNFPSKQIKNAEFLAGALFFINALKRNGLEVIIGYTNIEGLLYSVAGADGVTMGSYENLRNFQASRFEDNERSPMRGPNARLYFGKLLQFVEYGYIGPMKELLPDFGELIEDSHYRPLMFAPEFQWHFQKPELYKHYFLVFTNQIRSLSGNLEDRKDQIKALVESALKNFDSIREFVALDSESDGSHLPHWMNAISLYDKYRKEIGL